MNWLAKELQLAAQLHQKVVLFVHYRLDGHGGNAGKGVGPFMMRDLYETIDLSTPVHIVRTYQISRNNIEKAIEIMKEIGKLSPSNTLSAVVPVMAPQMDQISAIYHFDSMGSAGKYMDEISMKSEFQELLKQASNLGTLIRAGFNIRM